MSHEQGAAPASSTVVALMTLFGEQQRGDMDATAFGDAVVGIVRHLDGQQTIDLLTSMLNLSDVLLRDWAKRHNKTREEALQILALRLP